MSDITHADAVVTENKLTEFYEDIKPFLGCPAYLTSEGNAEYYSTDEKVIGRWTDGKPLYQKVIDLGVLTNNKTVNHNISNLDAVVDVQGMAYNGTGQYLKLAFINLSNSYYGSLIVDKTKISIIASGITDRSGFAILNYTKTTDSAATTMQEDPNEYSTTEKIIGKWIDGKPIYQKVLVIESTVSQNGWIPFPNNNIDLIIKYGGTGYYRTQRYARPFPWDVEGNYANINAWNSTGLEYSTNSSINTLMSGSVIWIQYTKTTD